jgi:hypothetical protein
VQNSHPRGPSLLRGSMREPEFTLKIIYCRKFLCIHKHVIICVSSMFTVCQCKFTKNK